MTEEKVTSFEVKTVLIFWHNFILLSTTFLFAAGLMTTFNPKNFGYVLIIYAVSFLAGYFLSGIAKSKAKLNFEDGKIIIEQANSFIKRGSDISIELNDLRGFEVGELTTRYDTSLVLYKKDFKTYRYLLENKTDGNNLKIFLAQYVPLLDAKANPMYSSFKKAFWFVVKNILILFLFTTITWSVLAYFIDLNKINFASISFLIPVLFWHLITKKQLKKNYFRFSATYSLMLIFLFIAIGLLIPTMSVISELVKKPFFIESPKNVFVHANEKFFYIKNIEASADKIITSYKIGSNSGKSSTFNVSHFIETRATDLNNNFDNIWLRKELEQKINKSISVEGQTFLVNEFQIKAKKEFEKLINKKASFYRVITIRTTGVPLAILEPYGKSLDSYKLEVQKKLSYLIGAIIILLLIGVSVITLNR